MNWHKLRVSDNSAKGEAAHLTVTYVRPEKPPFKNVIHVEFGYRDKYTQAVCDEVTARLVSSPLYTQLIELQANVRSIREDYHGPRPSADERAVMDERLNAIEAKITEIVEGLR